MAALILVCDASGRSWDDLLPGGTLCRFARQIVGSEGFREYSIDPVGPAAVMLDNLVGDLGHASLLMRMAGTSVSTQWGGQSFLKLKTAVHPCLREGVAFPVTALKREFIAAAGALRYVQEQLVHRNLALDQALLMGVAHKRLLGFQVAL